jgi:hypothetical protein
MCPVSGRCICSTCALQLVAIEVLTACTGVFSGLVCFVLQLAMPRPECLITCTGAAARTSQVLNQGPLAHPLTSNGTVSCSLLFRLVLCVCLCVGMLSTSQGPLCRPYCYHCVLVNNLKRVQTVPEEQQQAVSFKPAALAARLSAAGAFPT